ncbi:hypothetical protein [Nocardia farcinica]|nr:hypothetical protein [Nocardia farcinica]
MTTQPPAAPPPGRRRTNAIILGVVGAVLAVVLLIVIIGAVAGGDEDVPVYTVTRDQQTFTATVDFDDEADLRAVFDDVREKNSDLPDGGYDVMINCSTGGTAEVPARLAWGRFAIGNLGAAQTGLEKGDSELKLMDGVRCPA